MPKVTKQVKTVIPDSDSDESSSAPIVQQKTSKKQQVETKKVAKIVQKEESDSEEEAPIVQKKPTKQVKTQNGAGKKIVVPTKKAPKPSSSQEEESEEEAPKVVVKAKSPLQKAIVKAKSPLQKAVVPKKAAKEPSSEQQSQEESEKPTPKVKAGVKKVAAKPVAKKVAKVESSESEEESEEAQPVKKAKSPIQKPIQKVKSPVQKALAKPVRKAESSDEEEEAPQPVKKGANKQVEQDEEGEFEVIAKGLSFQAYEDDIRTLFGECGEILNVKLLLRPDGKSKGLAFIKFGKKSAFNKALELNGSEQFGRPICVEEATGRKDGGFQKGGNDGGYPQGGEKKGGFNKFQGSTENVEIKTPTLFIGGLSWNSTVESISEYFGSAGEVIRARIVSDKETGKPRGFGYVEFPDVETAKKAYESLNHGNLDGRQIRLDSAAERERPAGGFGGGQGGYGGGQGGYGGGQGGFGGGNRGGPRNGGNSRVDLSQDDKFAKKGAMGTFQGKKMNL